MPYDPDGEPDEGRVFRDLPPAEQLDGLVVAVLNMMLTRKELEGILAAAGSTPGDGDPRHLLLQGLDRSIGRHGGRIIELGGVPPEYP